MNRRETVGALLALSAAPLVAEAQQARKAARVGVIRTTGPTDFPQFAEAFRSGLRQAGYVEGQNVSVEYRWAEGDDERIPMLAADLVQLNVDAIVASGTEAALAARRASPTIPLVFLAVGDPVGSGLVATLAHPGGNTTGLAFLTPELNGKRLEQLRQASPASQRVAVLLNPGNDGHRHQLARLEQAASALRVKLVPVEVQRPKDFDDAFIAIAKDRSPALMIMVSGLHHRYIKRLAELAIQWKVASTMEFTEFAKAGGLMAYGPSWTDFSRQAGAYVGKILKGTKPADLPVEQPTNFEFVINLKTAKALGLTIPASLLVGAETIE
jgi:putative tryptophan/tyrosine transport system substrate-binding protein